MAAVSLKRVAVYRSNNLQTPLVWTHFIHLVINVLAMASSRLPSLHSATIPLPLLFCQSPAIRPCHTNVGSFENISFFFQCFGLGSALSWHHTTAIRSKVPTLRNNHLPWLAGSILQPNPLSYYLITATKERYVKENTSIWHSRYLTYPRCFFSYFCLSQCRFCETH